MTTMTARDLKERYLSFFASKGHARIPSAPIIPEGQDPTVLFTTAGMHPLVPFLMGQQHPLGKRVCSVQRCIRTGDIDEVGDTTHHTFFEMLGNWSFGDYFKQDAICWSYEFLTRELRIPITRLAVSCFAGDADAPRDDEAAAIWTSLGIPRERIAFLPKKDNWWGPAGKTGPCGPDTEMFYWSDNQTPAPASFDPSDKRWVEIWNDVFMQYDKQPDGTYAPLAQRNVDTGMGVERTTAVLQGISDNYRTECFWPIIERIQDLSGREYEGNERSMRIIADHIRAAVFILGDERGVLPSNVDQGYILRRLIRRAIRHARQVGIQDAILPELGEAVIHMSADAYPLLEQKRGEILEALAHEEERFSATLTKGLNEFARIVSGRTERISGETAFLLFQSFGFPLEMTQELAAEKGLEVDAAAFHAEFEKHQELSRQGAERKFKGGLADAKEETVRLHTATHLLNEALRRVISPDIKQRGSNITTERLRFDFNFDRKLTHEEVKAVEDEVNRCIQEAIPVVREEMPLQQALSMGAQAEFGARYPEVVSVYSVGDYSRELCGGPHVHNTKEIGRFRIVKEEASAAGVRRIKAVVE